MTSPDNSTPLELIVGIGNPGANYADTRHNAGIWFVEALAEQCAGSFRSKGKFFGRTAVVALAGREVRLLIPETYMNASGKSVAALVDFFRIDPARMLVAHDEIEFPVGRIRFKQGGGLAGHNGLRDVSRRLSGTTDFNRLRIGVGRPGGNHGVTEHVLGRVTPAEREIIETCIGEAIAALPPAVGGDWQAAMQRLHTA